MSVKLKSKELTYRLVHLILGNLVLLICKVISIQISSPLSSKYGFRIDKINDIKQKEKKIMSCTN